MNSKQVVVFLGFGLSARYTARLLSDATLYGTTRFAKRFEEISAASVVPLLFDDPKTFDYRLFEGADLLVSFPPDGSTDSILAPRSRRANSVVYLSSTGVYGKTAGVINEDSEVDDEEITAKNRLTAEILWRSYGATVLRCAGLYARESGLHTRLKNGTFKLPSQMNNYVSRIHLEDLSRIIVALFQNPKPGALYVVADRHPSTHIEAVSWLCEKMQIPLPQTADMNDLSRVLRGNRQIDSSRLLTDLKIDLLYPSFKEGYSQILTGSD